METTLKPRVLYAESLLSWGRDWKADFVWGEEENFIWCLRYHIASRRRWMCAPNLVSFYFIFWDTVSFMLPTQAALEFLSCDDPPASAFWDSKTIDASLHLSLDSIVYSRKSKGRDEYVSASCLGWWLFTANLTRIRIIWKTGRRDCWWCLWPYFQRRSTLECTTSCQHPSFSGGFPDSHDVRCATCLCLPSHEQSPSPPFKLPVRYVVTVTQNQRALCSAQGGSWSPSQILTGGDWELLAPRQPNSSVREWEEGRERSKRIEMVEPASCGFFSEL